MSVPFILEGNGVLLIEADALVEVTERLVSKYCQSLHAEFFTKSQKKNAPPEFIRFYWSRYAMTGMGFHNGYEEWEVYIPLIDARFLGWNNSPRCVWGDKVAVINSDLADIKLASRPRIERGEEGYYPPDDDFGWQEFDALFDQVKEEMKKAERVFNPETREWSLKSPQVEVCFGNVESNLEDNRESRR